MRGESFAGDVAGRLFSGSITACHHAQIAIQINDGVPGTLFSSGVWPGATASVEWGTGDGSGSGKYRKSLGGWNGGSPVYPKLYWE